MFWQLVIHRITPRRVDPLSGESPPATRVAGISKPIAPSMSNQQNAEHLPAIGDSTSAYFLNPERAIVATRAVAILPRKPGRHTERARADNDGAVPVPSDQSTGWEHVCTEGTVGDVL